MLVTADGGWRRGKVVPLKQNADEARRRRRRRSRTSSSCAGPGTPIRFDERPRALVARADGRRADRLPAGEDGRRAPALHPLHLGHDRASRRASCTRPAATSSARTPPRKWVFDLKDEDVYWCTADIGWVTGHSYVVYGPLANGATCLMYEGAPDTPDEGRFWELIEQHGVTILYTAPDGDPRVHEVGRPSGRRSTTSPRCGCSAPSASRSIPKRGCGTRRTSAAGAARSSTRGGRPRPA